MECIWACDTECMLCMLAGGADCIGMLAMLMGSPEPMGMECDAVDVIAPYEADNEATGRQSGLCLRATIGESGT